MTGKARHFCVNGCGLSVKCLPQSRRYKPIMYKCEKCGEIQVAIDKKRSKTMRRM